MLSIAKSPLTSVPDQRVPVRGSGGMLFSSYARTSYQSHECIANGPATGGHLLAISGAMAARLASLWQ